VSLDHTLTFCEEWRVFARETITDVAIEITRSRKDRLRGI
jgi:hypothetical protein